MNDGRLDAARVAAVLVVLPVVFNARVAERPALGERAR
jgi:hypothetical protein